MAIEIKNLIQALQIVEQQRAGRSIGVGSVRGGTWDTVTDSPSGPYIHGIGGIFGVLGLEQDVISTRVSPRGLAGAMPARATNVMWPEFPYIMGFQDSGVADDEMGTCDDPPVAGAMVGCIQTAQFGRYAYETRTLDVGRVLQQINRGEFMDLRIVNEVINPLDNITPDSGIVDRSLLLQREMLERMVEVGIAYQNKLVRQVWTANPSNNNSGGGYREFPGLDLLIGTNKIDAHTQQVCDGLDSIVQDFAYADVTDNAGLTIVNDLTWMYRNLKYRAERQNMEPARWVFCMRQSLFWEITAVWPCAYMTYRCQIALTMGESTSTNMINANDQVAMRDDMRNNKYLLIDGERVPVTIDDGIVEETHTSDSANVPTGCFASKLYIIPMVVNGNLASCYWEFYDYKNALQAAHDANFISQEFWTDGGRFLWMRKVPKLQCIQLASAMQPRVILRTPHLAAKVLNIGYCPLIHEQSPLPGDTGFTNAGVTDRSGYGPSIYGDWGALS